jgi:hypothetical protein
VDSTKNSFLNMNQVEFEILIDDETKTILGDIRWSEDEDHSPSVEFRAEIESAAGYPIFARGSFNRLAGTLSYLIVHRGSGRIYALDMGKDHHNPDCVNVGEKHKHRWNEPLRDKEAYVPEDITRPSAEPLAVWEEFCAEARIHHEGQMHQPPEIQLDLI